MSDVINPDKLRTGSQAINATIAQFLASRDGPRGGLVISNQTDGTIYISGQDGTADASAYPVETSEELALGDYRGAVWIRGDGSGSVYYAYTE
jgi:hypothetical protein